MHWVLVCLLLSLTAPDMVVSNFGGAIVVWSDGRLGLKDVFIEHRISFQKGRITAVLDLVIYGGTGQP